MKGTIEEKVSEYIAVHRLLRPEGRYLAAFSGGADSTLLLLLLAEMGYHAEAVHCNFHLRGDESDRDEQHVRDFCRHHGIVLHTAHFDTKTYAALHKVGIEMAARQLRYHYFEQLRSDLQADGICVAHHRDDSIETVLLNLVRGTGLRGLAGIQPRNGYILRPMLCLSRDEIEAALKARGQAFVTDSTNLLPEETARNKIRLQVLPLLKEINHSVSECIAETAQHLGEALKIQEAAVEEALQRCFQAPALQIDALMSEPSPELVLHALLSRYGFTPSTVMQLYRQLAQAPTGSRWVSATHEAVADRGQLVVMPLMPPRPTRQLPETGTYVYDERLKFKIDIEEGRHIRRDADCACLDSAKMKWPLTIRPVRTGDRFKPLGMDGTRLVSDFLTDRKVPLPDKRRQLVVTDSTDTIVWVVGHRPDQRFRITEQTTHTLLIRLIGV